ncbi:MAG: bifunctional metallophosphatase/5'-nucleotidase [Longispora sp.]|nr:bifunctional metallophosphatase/5'-nucleotidase [Longispora sp. (in: high G+C Gram-positive bacteria)]
MSSTGLRVKVALAAAVTALLAVGFLIVGTEFSTADTPGKPIRIQILSLNDFHGNLEALPGPSGAVTVLNEAGREVKVQAGGIARIATLLRTAREGQSATITVGVGDMIGGSPFTSAIYHDEPSIHALEKLGMEFTAAGNHEFDEGLLELSRIIDGGCHPNDGCAMPGEAYPGAPFPYLGANVIDNATGKPVLPAYVVKELSGIKVGFIGIVTHETPSRVMPAGIEGLTFADEAETINKYAEELNARGVRAIVALVHEGAEPASPVYDADCDAHGPGSGISGPITSIAKNSSPKVDLILTGHSHHPYICNIPDPKGQRRLVTQAAAFGRTFTDIQFDVDSGTGHILRDTVRAKNKIVTLDTAEDPDLKAYVDTWKGRSSAQSDKIAGFIGADFLGRGATTLETQLGDTIVDAQTEATRDLGAQLAFCTIGGMRSDLMYRSGAQPGVVTFGNLFEIQPFGNELVTMNLTGAQLLELLRQQFTGLNAEQPRLLQPSNAFRATVDLSREGGDKVLADSIRVDGKPLDHTRVYRVTVNSFLAAGGNGFTVFENGTNRVTSPTNDVAALFSYLKNHSSADRSLMPPPADRVTVR